MTTKDITVLRDKLEEIAAKWKNHTTGDIAERALAATERAAIQPAGDAARLNVVLGSMSESNGRTTWDVLLVKSGDVFNGHSVYTDSIKGRAEYEADSLRHFLGLGPKPDMLAYDTDAPAAPVQAAPVWTSEQEHTDFNRWYASKGFEKYRDSMWAAWEERSKRVALEVKANELPPCPSHPDSAMQAQWQACIAEDQATRQPVAAPSDECDEYAGMRLRAVAKRVGVSDGILPKGDKQLDDCRFAVLGYIARELSKSAAPVAPVAAPQPDVSAREVVSLLNTKRKKRTERQRWNDEVEATKQAKLAAKGKA